MHLWRGEVVQTALEELEHGGAADDAELGQLGQINRVTHACGQVTPRHRALKDMKRLRVSPKPNPNPLENISEWPRAF